MTKRGTRRNEHIYIYKCKYCTLTGIVVLNPEDGGNKLPQTSVITYKITYHNPEDHNTNLHCQKNPNLTINLSFKEINSLMHIFCYKNSEELVSHNTALHFKAIFRTQSLNAYSKVSPQLVHIRQQYTRIAASNVSQSVITKNR